jgi:hypothetical protein
MTRPTQPVVTVRADRRGVVVERPGASPWIFPPARSLDAIELPRTAARLFGARLIVELDREGGREPPFPPVCCCTRTCNPSA